MMGGNQQYQVLSLGGSTPKKTKILEQDTKFLTSTYSFTSLIQVPEFLEGFSHFTNLR